MPKINVYIPQPLYDKLKLRGRSINLSAMMQTALELALRDIELDDLDFGARFVSQLLESETE